jgi:hypothetical protein
MDARQLIAVDRLAALTELRERLAVNSFPLVVMVVVVVVVVVAVAVAVAVAGELVGKSKADAQVGSDAAPIG